MLFGDNLVQLFLLRSSADGKPTPKKGLILLTLDANATLASVDVICLPRAHLLSDGKQWSRVHECAGFGSQHNLGMQRSHNMVLACAKHSSRCIYLTSHLTLFPSSKGWEEVLTIQASETI